MLTFLFIIYIYLLFAGIFTIKWVWTCCMGIITDKILLYFSKDFLFFLLQAFHIANRFVSLYFLDLVSKCFNALNNNLVVNPAAFPLMHHLDKTIKFVEIPVVAIFNKLSHIALTEYSMNPIVLLTVF